MNRGKINPDRTVRGAGGILGAMIAEVVAAGYLVTFDLEQEAAGIIRVIVKSGREGDRREDTGPTREGALAKVMTAMGWDMEG